MRDLGARRQASMFEKVVSYKRDSHCRQVSRINGTRPRFDGRARPRFHRVLLLRLLVMLHAPDTDTIFWRTENAPPTGRARIRWLVKRINTLLDRGEVSMQRAWQSAPGRERRGWSPPHQDHVVVELACSEGVGRHGPAYRSLPPRDRGRDEARLLPGALADRGRAGLTQKSSYGLLIPQRRAFMTREESARVTPL